MHCFSLPNAEFPNAELCEERYGIAICNAWRSSVVFSEAGGRAEGRSLFSLVFVGGAWGIGPFEAVVLTF
jgi:hypothetical protein